ncbi:hypothetical protein HDZ31DRAFT_60446 [Schizophyllum fasciatum]
MVRCELSQGILLIAYGDDDAAGYFLSVYDNRLEWHEDASDEINEVCEDVDPSGSGAYLSLTTGLGIGKHVSKDTLAIFWRRYGVPASQIARLRGGQAIQEA